MCLASKTSRKTSSCHIGEVDTVVKVQAQGDGEAWRDDKRKKHNTKQFS